MRFLFLFIFLFPLIIFSQTNTATVFGKVVDEDDEPIKGVSVQFLNKSKGSSTDEKGNFSIKIPSNKLIAVEFIYTGFITVQNRF